MTFRWAFRILRYRMEAQGNTTSTGSDTDAAFRLLQPTKNDARYETQTISKTGCGGDDVGCARRSIDHRMMMRPVIYAAFPVFVLLLFVRPHVSHATPSYLITLQPQHATNNKDPVECFDVRLPSQGGGETPYILSGNFDCWEESDAFVRECRHVEGWIERVFLRELEQQAERFPWRSTPGASEEDFHVTVLGGGGGAQNRFRLCFAATPDEDEDDNAATVNALRLGFHLRVQSAAPRSLPDTELGPDAQRALALLEAATIAEQHWYNLRDHFDFYRNREAVHRQLMRQTFAKIMGWTILEAVLVVTMAVAQVCYWKSFFEQRRYL